MTKHKLTDAIESTDAETKIWKSRFAAAKAAYAEGQFKECEGLLVRAMEQGKALKEKTFAVNTCLVGQGAVYLSMGELDRATRTLSQAISAISGSTEPALKELHAVALRIFAEVCSEEEDYDEAEDRLRKALEILETLGEDGAVQLAYTMSDLATVYLKQNDLHQAGELVVSSMELLAVTEGPETPEYVRANVIYDICHAKNEEEFIGAVEDSIEKMRYHRGRKHPNIVRAVRWYAKRLREHGDEAKIAELGVKFSTICS
jgi:tetratricopeptide (TPR) repeat protein